MSMAFRILLVGGVLALATTGVSAQQRFTPEQALERMESASVAARQHALSMGFDAFRAQVTREPGPHGKYIVNGDTPIVGEAGLRAFYDGLRNAARRGGRYELATGTTRDGADDIWDDQARFSLTYCVSTAFGPRHGEVVAAMEAAAKEWETVARLDFIHLAQHDGACDLSTAGVLFDVSPGQEGLAGAPYARAFFPHDERPARNVLIWQSSFQTTGALTLTGILRHELGHTIGLRHEHTRPESGECFEDDNWRGVTTYDAFSVMHYPQCNGKGDWSLALTEHDRSGIACLYGPAPGFTIDTSICSYAPGDPFGGNYGAGSGTGQNQGAISVTLE